MGKQLPPQWFIHIESCYLTRFGQFKGFMNLIELIVKLSKFGSAYVFQIYIFMCKFNDCLPLFFGSNFSSSYLSKKQKPRTEALLKKSN